MYSKQSDNNYDDIINLPHHQSETRPHMSLYDRAAQFSPFSALTGYNEAVKESARLTDKNHELSEEAAARLDKQLLYIRQNIKEQPQITITYFLHDKRKDGGAYVSESGIIKQIDDVERVVILQSNTKIPLDDISDISGETLPSFNNEF